MNCNDVARFLSPFYDGELKPAEHEAVAAHLAACAVCSEQLESVRRLSDLVAGAPSPDAPESLVARVEQSLGARAAWPGWFGMSGRAQAAAALVAVAAAIVLGLTIWRNADFSSHSHVEMLRDFGEFLEAYEQAPAASVALLPHKYDGRLVSREEATSALKRATVAPSVVLTNHRAAQRYLLKMPCCDCVQTVYECQGISTLVLFEHEKEQSDWFGARPRSRSELNGKSCCLVPLKSGLVATWPVAGGFVTAVGVQDLAELSQLVDEVGKM